MSPPTPVEILQPPVPLADAGGTPLGPFRLAEAPTWDAQAGRLWWADIEDRSLHSLDFDASENASLLPGTYRRYEVEQKVCAIGLARSGRLLLALAVQRFAEVVRIEKLSLAAGSGTQTDYLRAEVKEILARPYFNRVVMPGVALTGEKP